MERKRKTDFIDAETGEMIISKYDVVEDFADGFAAVKYNDK
jgi:hypothetical protein